MLAINEKNNIKPDKRYDCNGKDFYSFAIDRLRPSQLEVWGYRYHEDDPNYRDETDELFYLTRLGSTISYGLDDNYDEVAILTSSISCWRLRPQKLREINR
ncbi:hypothetical protein [Commensalibacter melissae]|uniref:hypothetical protein n=1 Tax=Commensalibacter melissae TaxID=2070537 RepID=UPI0012D8CF53|nr:hypothetical protein [Commensalibacter melissae]MUH06589.1 hypothetical protein [Commensalibacter melissae]